jgi:hypothetical protein
MEKTPIYLLGCSFTNMAYNYGHDPSNDFFMKFISDFNIINLSYISRSNFQILEDIKTLPKNSIAIIQWSSLTRPNGIQDYDKDWNKHLNELAQSAEDPLKFLINNFINVVNQANQILNEKQIKSFQYLGWLQWADSEIDSETEQLLKELPIKWFVAPNIIDIYQYNCWEYNHKSLTNKLKTLLGGIPNKWEWKSTKWGGLSEWVRLNIKDPYKRYHAIKSIDGYNDTHPSKYALEEFYKNVILHELNKLINDIK